jgi:hypothetical protein
MRAYQYVEWHGPSLIEGPLAGTLRRFSKEPAEYHDRIAFAAQWLGPKRVSELERLGTALYVTLTEDIPSQDRAARICELKPLRPVEAQAAVAELDAMIAQARQHGLIPVSSTQDVAQ